MSRNQPRPRTSRSFAALLLLAIVAAFTAMFMHRRPRALSVGFAPPPAASGTVSNDPIIQSHLVSNGSTRFVHSATAAEIGDGRIRSFWLGGTRESHSDVAIFTSLFDYATRLWSPEKSIITIDWVRRHLARNVIALGNPVAMQHEDGRLFLWFVSVSIGGWSGSAINMTVSYDGGETWQPPVRLITSPFLNISTLVRQPAFAFADGTIGLPVYHECMGLFAELLRLDTHGRVLHKQRLTWGRSTLQPKIVSRNQDEAVGFLRRAGSAPRHVIGLQTDDGGLTWSSPRALDMHNPGAPIAAVRLDSGELLIAFNNTQRQRTHLTLAISDDEGNTSRIIQSIDGDGRPDSAQDVSYPFLIRSAGGHFHMLYTADNKHIKHVHFNMAWLEQNR
jgi:predicted neuraminidase